MYSNQNNNNIEQNFMYGAYARKSSESEDKQVQSIERQIDELLELQEKENLTLFDKPIEESKSAFSIGRDGFNRLIKLTEQGKINAWLCWHANRLSRNPIDAGIIIHLMDLGKLQHIRTPSRIYYNTPTDKMMLQIEFTMSKKDSDDKSIFVKSGLEKRYKKGFPNGKAPIGYLNDKTKERGNRDWLVDRNRYKKLKKLFNRFLEAKDSISSITAYARDQLELTTPKYKRLGGKLVGRSYVAHMLKNPIYAGFFYSLDRNGKQTTRRELHPSVPRLISEHEHIKILNILGSRVKPKMQLHQTLYYGRIKSPEGDTIGADLKFQMICDCKHKFAYRSKEKCPKCLIEIDKMQSPHYLSYIYYYNIKRRKDPNLKAKCIEESKIDEYLYQYFKSHFYVHPFLMKWAVKHLKDLKDMELNMHIEKEETYKAQLIEFQERKQRLLNLYTKGHIEEAIYLKEQSVIKNQETQLQQSPELIDWLSVIERYLNFGKESLSILENGHFDAKQELLDEFSSNLIWNEENLNVSNVKWLSVFEKGLKSVKAKYPQFEPENPTSFKGSKALFGTKCPIVLGWLDNVRTYLLQDKGFRDHWCMRTKKKRTNYF